MQLYNTCVAVWFRITQKVVIDQRKVQKSGKKLESDINNTEKHKRKCAETQLWVGISG